MQQVIIGAGEVGKAIGLTLQDLGHEVTWADLSLPPNLPEAKSGDDADALHICLPFGPEFIEQVKSYYDRHPTTVVIIHSTVKPGTCDQLADVLAERSYFCGRLPPAIVFSPIRGSHRSNYNDGGLRPALRRFVKYYAVVSDEAGQAETRFLRAFRGLTLKAFPDVRSLEFAKVMSTTYFGWVIAFEKRMHDACEKHGFDFDAAYTDWNRTYNDGMPEQFRRPVIQHREGKIGGHCVISNLLLLEGIEEVGPLFDEVILWG
jgi:UDP-N-acetyl-D-mannosaminuronate dehydrogenase